MPLDVCVCVCMCVVVCGCMWLYVCVCVCVCVVVCVCMCWLYVWLYVCACMSLLLCACVYVYICECLLLSACAPFIVYIFKCVHLCMCVCARANVSYCVCAHVYCVSCHRIQEMWRENEGALLEDIEKPGMDEEVVPAQIVYETAFNYFEVMSPLVSMEAEHDKAVKEAQSTGQVVVRWEPALNHKWIAVFLYPKSDAGLCLLSTEGGVHCMYFFLVVFQFLHPFMLGPALEDAGKSACRFPLSVLVPLPVKHRGTQGCWRDRRFHL